VPFLSSLSFRFSFHSRRAFLQHCKAIESVQLENGRPSASEVAGGNAIPSYVVAPNAQIWDLVHRNNTRLRIFSSTANPALSQVVFFLERFVLFLDIWSRKTRVRISRCRSTLALCRRCIVLLPRHQRKGFLCLGVVR